MKNSINSLSRFWYKKSLGLLLIRVATGVVFFVHGYEKFQHLDGVSNFMISLGMPGIMGATVATIEVVGGLMLILGVATRAAAVALTVVMVFAIFLTNIYRGFHAHEFEMVLAATSAGIALIGSGRYSLHKMEDEHGNFLS